jgi:hypothetical protein
MLDPSYLTPNSPYPSRYHSPKPRFSSSPRFTAPKTPEIHVNSPAMTYMPSTSSMSPTFSAPRTHKEWIRQAKEQTRNIALYGSQSPFTWVSPNGENFSCSKLLISLDRCIMKGVKFHPMQLPRDANMVIRSISLEHSIKMEFVRIFSIIGISYWFRLS